MVFVKKDYPEIKCVWCGDSFKPVTKNHKACSKACKNSNWRVTRTTDIGGHYYTYGKYKKDYCEFCRFKGHRCQFDVDHIDGNHHNNDPNNLQTLCANCHRLKSHKQDHPKFWIQNTEDNKLATN